MNPKLTLMEAPSSDNHFLVGTASPYLLLAFGIAIARERLRGWAPDTHPRESTAWLG